MGQMNRIRSGASKWYVYIVLCHDSTLYCGITLNLEKRIKAHNEGRGARYTRGRGPVILVCSIGPFQHSTALRIELAVKKQPASEKVQFLLQLSNL